MKSDIKLDESTVQDVSNHLTQIQHDTVNAGIRGIDEAAEILFNQAQMIVPRKTGALANSGKISYRDTAKQHEAIISYGDASTNPNTGRATSVYAVQKHEMPGPGSKWLEKTFLGGYDIFMQSLVNNISETL